MGYDKIALYGPAFMSGPMPSAAHMGTGPGMKPVILPALKLSGGSLARQPSWSPRVRERCEQMKRSGWRNAGVAVAMLALAGCVGADPSNIGDYYSCADWTREHRSRSALARAQDDWAFEQAGKNGYDDVWKDIKEALPSNISNACESDPFKSVQRALDDATDTMIRFLVSEIE